MKKKVVNIFILLLTLCLGYKIEVLNAGDNGADTITTNYSPDYNVEYYDDIKGLKGDELLEGLATISQNNHKYYNSYDKLRVGNAYSDEDPNDSTKIIDFYTHWSISNIWDSGKTWNREHVWCQSLSNGTYGTSGAGSDIHHLRPEISGINSSRGNKPFADLENSEENKHYYQGKETGCYTNTTSFEPADCSKGDTARILMYVYMHYSTEVSANVSYNKAGNLVITNIVSTSEGTNQAAWDLLLKWSELDPVDTFEMSRNNYCASVTGLRNPFIDHPEFAKMIWETNYSGEGALESEIEEYLKLSISTLTLEVGSSYELKPLTNISNPIIEYTSLDESIASVSSAGLITALKEGEVTIKVKCNGLETSLSLVVTKKEEKYNGITNQSTYKVNSKTSVTSNDAPLNTNAVYSQTYSTASQITWNNSATLTLSGYEGYTIKGFTLEMKSNTSKGSGSLSVTIGDNQVYSIADSAFNTSNWNGNYATSYVDISRSLDTPYKVLNGEDIIFLIEASVNSLYIQAYTIYYSCPLEIVKSEIEKFQTLAQLDFSYNYEYLNNEIVYNSFYGVNLRYSVSLPMILFDYVDSYGINITIEDNSKDINISNNSLENDNYSYALVLKNISDYDVKITATAYVYLDNERVELISKSYSVIEMVDYYLDYVELDDNKLQALEAFKEYLNGDN